MTTNTRRGGREVKDSPQLLVLEVDTSDAP